MSTVEQAILRTRMVADIVDDLERRLAEAKELLLQMETSLRDSKEAVEDNVVFRGPVEDWEDL